MVSCKHHTHILGQSENLSYFKTGSDSVSFFRSNRLTNHTSCAENTRMANKKEYSLLDFGQFHDISNKVENPNF